MVIYLLIPVLIVSCNSLEKKTDAADESDRRIQIKEVPKRNRNSESDTSFTVFNNENYWIEFTDMDSNTEEEHHLGVLKLLYQYDEQTTVVMYKDTLEFFMPVLKLQDFNEDGIQDLTILYNSSARSDWSYHLYLADSLNHTLHKVKGFEKICNPEMDLNNNIIKSIAHANVSYYSFYRINKKNKLVNLGQAFEGNGSGDSLKLEKAIETIVNESK